MAKKHCQVLSTLFFITVSVNFPATSRPDDTLPNPTLYASPLPPSVCSYPCLPPPTITSNCPPPPSPPLPTVSPPPPSGSGYYYPPPSEYYSPPSGYLPYYPPPWYIDNAPPPPDPILPYFPFYYKQPPPAPGFSSATRLVRSTVWISSFILQSLLCFSFTN